MVRRLFVLAGFKGTTHDALLPVDVVAELQRFPAMNVMNVNVEGTDAVDGESNDVACVMLMRITIVVTC